MSTVWPLPEGMQGFSKEVYEASQKNKLTSLSLALPVELPGGGRPSSYFRDAFKKGFSGWDVYALQVALNSHQKTFPIAEDGIFGPQTEGCVLREQKNHHLDIDGIIGSDTQKAICATEAKRAETADSIPVGLLLGIGQGESGLYFAAVSGPNWNGSYDGGVTQENLVTSEVGSISKWHHVFDLRASFTNLGKKLRAQYDGYYGQPGAKTNIDAWYAAITYHNWPAAANKMAENKFDSWRYYAVNSSGHGEYYGVDDYAYWVVAASGGRLITARQWRDDYIASKIIYVKSWTA